MLQLKSILQTAQLATKVYDYTTDCLQKMKAAGVTPDLIQTGNEITYGMLWPTGQVYPAGGNATGTMANFTSYLSNAIKACREQCPQAKIILHTELGNSHNSTVVFFKKMKEDDAFVAAPKWLDRDKNTLTGKVVAMPTKADIDFDIAVHLIVELYSK